MRTTLQRRAERAALERRQPVPRDWPLPYRGWFGSAENAEIDPRFAARLVNIWIDGGVMKTRPGYEVRSTAKARQRISYEFGAEPIAIECFATQIRAAGVAIGRACDGRFMTASISSAAVMADGLGPIVRFNGTTLDFPAFTTGVGETQPAEFDGLVAHQDRLYFWKSTGPLEFWHTTTVGATQGTLAKFPLDRLGSIRGVIVAMASWTVDSAESVDDLLVILTSAGDVVLYRGLNPADAADWSLWGKFRMAAPVSRFALLNHGPDLFVVTKAGLTSIRDVAGRGAPALVRAITTPIQRDMEAAIRAAGDSLNWQLVTPSSERYLIVSVPRPGAHVFFVFGFESGGWFEWSGFTPMNWRRAGGDLLATLDSGEEIAFGDVRGDAGAPIPQEWRSAWQRLGTDHVNELRPVIIGAGPLDLTVAVLADHAETARDLAEATQTVTLAAENESDAAAQPRYENVFVGIRGDVFQLRLAFSATYEEVTAVRWIR